jgi:hypothetical protein
MRRLAVLSVIVGHALVVSTGAAMAQAQSASLEMTADSDRVVLGKRPPSRSRRPIPCLPATHRPDATGSLGTSCRQAWSSSQLPLARDPVPCTAGRNWACRTTPQTDTTQTLSNATWEASHPEAQLR